MGPWPLLLLLLLHPHLANGPGTEELSPPLPAPSSISISSFNMEHTLSVLPGPGTPPEAHYAVQVLRLRKSSWRPVTGCVQLAAGQTCDLSGAFRDPYERYKARVQAVTPAQTSSWVSSGWFQPISDTVLGPPDVTVSGCGNCLTVQLRVPTKELHQDLQLRDLYREVTFSVQRSRDGAQFTQTLQYKEENVITYLQSGVEYCVSVSAAGLLNSNGVYSKPHCAFTSPPPSNSWHTLVFGLVGVFCVLGFLIWFVLVYGGRLSLKLSRHHLSRSLSYLVLSAHKRRGPQPEVSGTFSQRHGADSASFLLTRGSGGAVMNGEVDEDDGGPGAN